MCFSGKVTQREQSAKSIEFGGGSEKVPKI